MTLLISFVAEVFSGLDCLLLITQFFLLSELSGLIEIAAALHL